MSKRLAGKVWFHALGQRDAQMGWPTFNSVNCAGAHYWPSWDRDAYIIGWYGTAFYRR